MVALGLPWGGRLVAGRIAEQASVGMEELSAARLIGGAGIDGDRYATGRGTYSHKPHQDRQCTLIEVRRWRRCAGTMPDARAALGFRRVEVGAAGG